MADNAAKALIICADGTEIEVRNTVDDLLKRLDGSTSRHIPLMRITTDAGKDVWLNASQIREIQPYESK
jgi:hypothetical protein